MVRDGRWKCVPYVGRRPQLFHLETDPREVTDLGQSLAHADTRARLRADLEKIVDRDAINAQAFADQEARTAAHGGPRRSTTRRFGYVPAPGQTPGFG